MKLTQRQIYTGASLSDLIHIVVTGDTSQNPAGSSYAIPLQYVVDLVPPSSGGSGFDVFVTGGTYSSGTATFTNNTGGTFTVTGFSTSGGTGSTYTVDNGLSESPSGNFQLGGVLTKDTTISGNTNRINLIGSMPTKYDYFLNVMTSGQGGALNISASTIAVEIPKSSVGISIKNATAPIHAAGSLFSTFITSGNSTEQKLVMVLAKSTTGATDNSGVILLFSPGTTSLGAEGNGYIDYVYTDVSNLIPKNKFVFRPQGDALGLNGGTLEVYGDGNIKLNAYGQNTFSGTPSYGLGVNSVGDVVEYVISGGSVDRFTTGGTYSNGTAIFTDNTGVSFSVTGFSTGGSSTISGDYLPLSGGTVSGNTRVDANLSANTVTINNTPTLNNNPTHLLSRNPTTGVVEYTDASQYLNEASTDQIYGNGVDGVLAFDGVNTYTGITSLSGGVYTLLRTIYASAVTISNGVVLDTDGFAIYAKESLTILNGGIIRSNGNNGGNGGAGTVTTALGGVSKQASATNYKISNTGSAGGNGGNTSVAGGTITASVNYLGNLGGAGGDGFPAGNSGAGATTAKGTVILSPGILQQPYSNNYLGHSLYFGTVQMFTAWGGAGGQCGINAGGAIQGGGGAGGSTGFMVPIIAKSLSLSGTTSLIQSNGGNGGNGGNVSSGNGTGGGGGGGAGGGFIYIITSSLNYTPNNQIQAKGGTGGTGGTGNGTVNSQVVTGVPSGSGVNGSDGFIVIINPVTGTNLLYNGQY